MEVKIVKAKLKDGKLRITEGKEKDKEIKETFRIPLYQRPYEWNDENVETLIKDLYHYKKSNNANKNRYFIGNIVVEKKGNYLDVIDGQQRFTTIYLLSKIIGKEYFKVDYEVREEANEFLKTLENINGKNLKEIEDKLNKLKKEFTESKKTKKFLTSEISKFVNNINVALKTLASLMKEKGNSVYDLKGELKKLLEIIEFSITFIPETVDAVKYFEVMNSRGKQLENHQVVKARLLSNVIDEMNEVERKMYAEIWDYCSKMNVYLEELFTKGNNEKKSDELLEIAFKFEDSKRVLKEFEVKFNRNSDNSNKEFPPFKCIKDIIFDKNLKLKVSDRTRNSKEYTAPIRKFSLFLLHTLKLFLAWEEKEKSKVGDVVINDTRLINQFEKHLLNGGKERIQKFITFLLRIRILYDYFIFKRDEQGIPDFKLSNKGENKKDDLYTNLLMIQLLFNVSSSQTQHWITAALWWLLNEGKKIWNENENGNEEKTKTLVKDFKKFLEKLDKTFAAKRLKEGESETNFVEIVNKYLEEGKIEFETLKELKEKLNKILNNGTATPHYWFYKLDYLLWRDFNWSKLSKNGNIREEGKFKYSNIKNLYRLTRLNSIEHIQPQSKVDKDSKWEGCKDMFGNLALVSNHMNSKLWNQEFPDKRAEIQKQLNNGTIESLKMLLVYSKYDEWTPKNCKEHHNEMIKLLEKDLESWEENS